MSPQDARRVRDLRVALKRAKPDDLLSLADCAIAWGVEKSRFVSVRNQIADFPDPRPATKEMGLRPNAIVYPARAAIEAMLGYAMRGERSAAAKAARIDAILGRSRKGEEPDALLSPNDLVKMNRLQAEIQERERDQRQYIPAAEVSAIAAEVFSELSDFLSTLANKVDPHGTLSAELRASIDEEASKALLSFHRRMKDMFAPDVDAAANREPARRSRRAPA
ncbi:MAG: hypothetical protein K2X76_05135 [Sphingomonas sp.]|nr:hypothetical protein [Sphingomonas sp.]